MKLYDLVIAGAGPAGCTLTLNLAGSGLKIAVIEKDIFPRKKICGDALSGKVMNVLKRLPGTIYQDFLATVEKEPSLGIRFVSPDLKELDLAFVSDTNTGLEAPGYICSRYRFDEFLFKQLGNFPNIDIFQGTRITGVSVTSDNVSVVTDKGEFRCSLIAGADGVHSIIRSNLLTSESMMTHHCIGIRSYYKNVSGLHPDNFIELIFLRELLPGYFWIFKGHESIANVGLGMLQTQIINRRINLSKLLNDLVKHHPYLSSRFKNAESINKPEAHALPLGTLKMKRSGNRFLLLGDAAYLVDPFSGEGIGNAMSSAECASQAIRNCFEKNSFTERDLSGYNEVLKRRLGNELRVSGVIQRLSRSPALFNFVINKANKNSDVKDLLRGMYTDESLREKLTRPSFYIKLLLF